MKRKINVALSLVWIVLVYGLFFYMRSQLKFPTLDLNNGGWLVPLFMTVSFWGLVFALVSVEKRKKLRVFSSVFIIIGIIASLCYTTVTTFFFNTDEPGIYPLYSQTSDPDDYLIFDERFEGNYEYLTEIMPKKIPEEAENVIYEYKYNSTLSGSLKASWSLPQVQYDALKKETLNKEGDIAYGEGVTTFTAAWNITDIPAFWTNFIVEFNDVAKTVTYSARQIYCC